jgi:putative spermidine/putrescine transport system permease protein
MTSIVSEGTTTTGPMLAADGTPLKKSLNRALRMQKTRALLLIAPLLIFVLITFVAPIADMLFRSVENQIVSETLPSTTRLLSSWDPETGDLPDENVFLGLYIDMALATEMKTHTRLGTRLNYEFPGASSLMRKSGRGVENFATDTYTEAFEALDPRWTEGATWVDLFGRDDVRDALPFSARTWDRWTDFVTSEDDDPAEEDVPDFVFTALYTELNAGHGAGVDPMIDAAMAQVGSWEHVDLVEQFGEVDDEWLSHDLWAALKLYSPKYTSGYFLNAVDLQKTPEGIAARPESERIYVKLFLRTFVMSMAITLACILLGYPVAWLLANLSVRTANLLMILVLLPFWTSLLVRTSAWKIMLQQQGVINDTLVWLGIVSDDARLVMINNQTGTIIAMTHILLPFMILPLYSVMQTIPPTYLRAAKSLGATNWTAFWRVYFPQSVPGIGAGSILVFILAIGYYITPELVGGTSGVFISNRIAYHISSSLNWGLAAALGTILLLVVLALYWAYDRVVGIDNVKLGG